MQHQDTTPLKYCPKCKTTKPINRFHNKRERRDGHATRCKECVNEAARKQCGKPQTPGLPFTKLCECGCGQETSLAPRTRKKDGWIKGQPLRYIDGHNIAPYHDSLADAFWKHCERGAADECWLWAGAIASSGYGSLTYLKKSYSAHRVSYEIHYGEIAKADSYHGNCVLHKCDVRACCNPSHLFVGTQAQNMADRDQKGRKKHFRGEQHGRAKLAKADVLEMRRLHREGASQTDISRRYNVPFSTVHDVIRYKTWNHV